MSPKTEANTFDIILIGAGISNINCAYRLQTQHPHVKFAILESREDIGGTWSLFKYPGIRSDSDLHTFGFSWHPWPHASPIAEGPLIMSYLRECISTHGLDRYMNFHHKVTFADWSSKKGKWTLGVDHRGQSKQYTASIVVLGAGYYDYSQPLQTEIPGINNFSGKTIHPQFWPEDYDYTDKRIVIVGSGATAVTLLPSLSKKAAHVTMLQRSPTYIVTQRQDPPAILQKKILPRAVVALFQRYWFLGTTWLSAALCRWFPRHMKAVIAKRTRQLLPPKLSWDPHFNPRYYPWQQRLCLAPDGDFYKALHTPKADVVTSHIKTVTERGIELVGPPSSSSKVYLPNGDSSHASEGDNTGSSSGGGRVLDADVIVTATGLRMQFGGGIPLRVDGEAVATRDKLLWNGAMMQDVPNLFYMVGYTNASWTLGADDTAHIVCRLLRYMERGGIRVAVPRARRDHGMRRRRAWDLNSTYTLAAEGRLPKYGDRGPWRPRSDVIKDWAHARWGNITDGLHFVG